MTIDRPVTKPTQDSFPSFLKNEGTHICHINANEINLLLDRQGLLPAVYKIFINNFRFAERLHEMDELGHLSSTYTQKIYILYSTFFMFDFGLNVQII